MAQRSSSWDDLLDDGSDAGDPVIAGAMLLNSLLPSTRASLLKASQSGRAAAEPRLHGPQPRNEFYWHGRRCEFRAAADRYLLVVALWDSDAAAPHPERDVDVVMDELYGEDTEESKASASGRKARLKNLRFHVRKAFLEAGIPVTVVCVGGKIWLEELA